MNICISCGTSFSGYGACGSCRTQETIKNENQKNRQQTEYLNRQNELTAQREMNIQREMIERNAYEQRRFAAQQQQFAQEQLELENLKLLELQKQTRLIEEQTITTQEAFEAGFNINLITSNYLENCSKDFKFDNQYYTSKLNIAYGEGVNQKISELFANESIWIDKLTLIIKNLALEKRMLIIDNEEFFSGNVDLFLDPIEIKFDNIVVNFGQVSTSFSVEKELHTGNLKILNYVTNLSSNFAISSIYDEAFDIDDTLKIVNQEQRCLIRLESIQIKQLEGYTEHIANQKKLNDDIVIKNLKTLFIYVLMGYGVYVLFTAKFSIFNIVPAGCIWIFASWLGNGNWELVPRHNVRGSDEILKTLKSRLNETREKLNNKNIHIDFDNSSLDNISEKNSTEQFVRKNGYNKFIYFLIFTVILIGIFSLLYMNNFHLFKIKNEFSESIEMPTDVQNFIVNKNQCDISLNSSDGGADQKKVRLQNVKKFCPETDFQLADLRKKYSNDKLVVDKLSQFASVNILETGPIIGQGYEGLRSRLKTDNWKPWNFEPINNFEIPFPEVLICDEGICNSFFEKNNSNNIFHVTYKICNSPYDNEGCPGYENGFLMIENYETVTIQEANNIHKAIKDHFEAVIPRN